MCICIYLVLEWELFISRHYVSRRQLDVVKMCDQDFGMEISIYMPIHS